MLRTGSREASAARPPGELSAATPKDKTKAAQGVNTDSHRHNSPPWASRDRSEKTIRVPTAPQLHRGATGRNAYGLFSREGRDWPDALTRQLKAAATTALVPAKGAQRHRRESQAQRPRSDLKGRRTGFTR